jgi:hypothetical protein
VPPGEAAVTLQAGQSKKFVSPERSGVTRTTETRPAAQLAESEPAAKKMTKMVRYSGARVKKNVWSPACVVRGPSGGAGLADIHERSSPRAEPQAVRRHRSPNRKRYQFALLNEQHRNPGVRSLFGRASASVRSLGRDWCVFSQDKGPTRR